MKNHCHCHPEASCNHSSLLHYNHHRSFPLFTCAFPSLKYYLIKHPKSISHFPFAMSLFSTFTSVLECLIYYMSNLFSQFFVISIFLHLQASLFFSHENPTVTFTEKSTLNEASIKSLPCS